MLIVGKNYVISIPEKKNKPAAEHGKPLAADDPLWKKTVPYKRSKRPVMGIPVTYMGKPLTAAMRKKVEAKQAKREAARLRQLKKEKGQS